MKESVAFKDPFFYSWKVLNFINLKGTFFKNHTKSREDEEVHLNKNSGAFVKYHAIYEYIYKQSNHAIDAQIITTIIARKDLANIGKKKASFMQDAVSDIMNCLREKEERLYTDAMGFCTLGSLNSRYYALYMRF